MYFDFSIAEFSGMIQGKLQIQTAAVTDLVTSKKEFMVSVANH